MRNPNKYLNKRLLNKLAGGDQIPTGTFRAPDRWFWDKLLIGGQTMYIANSPFLDYCNRAGMNSPMAVNQHSDGNAIHTDTYAEEDGLLVLKEIAPAGTMQRFFPGFTNGVPCTWFSGKLEIVEGFSGSIYLRSGGRLRVPSSPFSMSISAGKFEFVPAGHTPIMGRLVWVERAGALPA